MFTLLMFAVTLAGWIFGGLILVGVPLVLALLIFKFLRKT